MPRHGQEHLPLDKLLKALSNRVSKPLASEVFLLRPMAQLLLQVAPFLQCRSVCCSPRKEIAGTAVAPPFTRTAQNKLQTQTQDLDWAPSPCWGHTIITRSNGSLSWGSCHCIAGAAIPLKGSGFLFHFLLQPSAQTQFFKNRVSEYLMLHLPSFVFKS